MPGCIDKLRKYTQCSIAQVRARLEVFTSVLSCSSGRRQHLRLTISIIHRNVHFATLNLKTRLAGTPVQWSGFMRCCPQVLQAATLHPANAMGIHGPFRKIRILAYKAHTNTDFLIISALYDFSALCFIYAKRCSSSPSPNRPLLPRICQFYLLCGHTTAVYQVSEYCVLEIKRKL